RIVTRATEVRGFSDWAKYAKRTGTGEYEVRLWNFSEHEDYLSPGERKQWNWPEDLVRLYEQAPFTYSDIAVALEYLCRTEEGRALRDDKTMTSGEGHDEPAGLLPYCKDVAERRGPAEWYFLGFRNRLLCLYKELAQHLIRREVPLVIVDEAHHW